MRVRQLLEHFGDAPAILRASKPQLLQARGIGEDTAEAIPNWEKTTDLSLSDVLNNPGQSMGHGFVLAMLLTNDAALNECQLR